MCLQDVSNHQGSVLKGVEVNNKILSPPSKEPINRNNICLVQKVPPEEFKTNTSIDNQYKALEGFSGQFFSHICCYS